jgi:hypothetical protein
VPSVGGPHLVLIGKAVSLNARGFPPRKRLRIILEPAREVTGAHGCCGVVASTRPVTSSAGEATIRFTWPRFYREWATGNTPARRLRWRDGTFAFVTVEVRDWLAQGLAIDRATARTFVVVGS